MLGKIVSFLKNRRIRWYEPKRAALHEQCPCCDYLSLPERGADLICPICFWEDDEQDLDNVDVPSGPNHAITLRQGRNNFHSFGACEKEMVKYVIPDHERSKFTHQPRHL